MRTRKKKQLLEIKENMPLEQQARRRARNKRPQWPYPPGVGDSIPEEFRHYHLPKDDYYYLNFPWKNSVEETANNFKLLAELNLPFEYAKTPSGCICYRLHRKHEKLSAIQAKLGPRDTVPVFMPGIQYKRRVEWRMHQQNDLAFLFKETIWQPVPGTTERRRIRTKPQPVEIQRVRKKK
jgi:hypothetical protein